MKPAGTPEITTFLIFSEPSAVSAWPTVIDTGIFWSSRPAPLPVIVGTSATAATVITCVAVNVWVAGPSASVAVASDLLTAIVSGISASL